MPKEAAVPIFNRRLRVNTHAMMAHKTPVLGRTRLGPFGLPLVGPATVTPVLPAWVTPCYKRANVTMTRLSRHPARLLCWLRASTVFLTIHMVMAGLCSSTAWSAKPTSKAEALIAEGLELRRAGQDAEALSTFEEAYRLEPTPRAAAQWGLCLQAVGRWSEADGRLAEALKAKTDPWIVKNRAPLKESLEQVKRNVGRVEVNGSPEGATVAINGHEVGTFPLSGAIPVNAGNLDIEVTKAGFKRGFRSVTIAGGQYERLVVRLEQDKLEAIPAARSTLPEHSTNLNGEALGISDEASPKPVYARPWFWIVAGAIAVGGTIAIIAATSGGGSKGPMIDDSGVFDR